MEKHVDTVFSTAKAFTDQIRYREGFKLVNEPQFTNICFWYLPPSLRGHEHNSDYEKKLHQVCFDLCFFLFPEVL